MSRRSVVAVCCVATALAGSVFAACGGATPKPVTAKPNINEAGQIETPGAKWVLDFNQWSGGTRIPLESGSVLVVGDGGERWLGKDGNFDSAPSILPDRILTAKKTADGFRYIGSGKGAVYVSKEPLGPATKLSDGVKGAKTIAMGKAAILAIDPNGDLMRSADGKTWSTVDVPQRDGPIIRIAMHESEGLIVTAPQRFFGTKDDGATWTVARSPGAGVKDVVVTSDGIEVTTEGDRFRFDPQWLTFSKSTGAVHHDDDDDDGHHHRDDEPDRMQRVIDGGRALELYADYSGASKSWLLAVGPFSAQLPRRTVSELTKCNYVTGALFADTVVLACDMEGEISKPTGDAGAAKKTTGYITKLFRSDDAGKTFRLDTTLEGGPPESEETSNSDIPLAIGPNGFVYLGRRCASRNDCVNARVRQSTNAQWKILGDTTAAPRPTPRYDDDDDYEDDYREDDLLRHVVFLSSGSGVYSIGVEREDAKIFRWKGDEPVAVTTLGHGVSTNDPASFSLDTDGTFRGYILDSTHTQKSFEYKDGSSVRWNDIPVDGSVAFAGRHGIAVSDDETYETSDGGKTWAKVVAPTTVNTVTMCTNEGCAADGGYRVGWDGAAGTQATTKKKDDPKAQYSRPLRCTAKDKWISLGSGNFPNVYNLDHGAFRYIVPVRVDGKLLLVTSKRPDPGTKTTNITIFDNPPASATAQYATYMQRGGFVAVRYLTGKDAKTKPGATIDISVAWMRDGSPKVMRANVAGIAATTKVREGDYDMPTRPSLPEVVSLQAKGVYFHPPVRDDAFTDANGNPLQVSPFYLLQDTGKVETLPTPIVKGDTGMVTVLLMTDQLVRLFPRNTSWTATAGERKIVWSFGAGLTDYAIGTTLFDAGGKLTFAVTQRTVDYPVKAWAVPLALDANLGPSTALPTQKSVGDTPKACDAAAYADTKAYEFTSPWVFGARRPVVTDIEGVAQVLVTENARIRMLSNGDSCVVAYDVRRSRYVKDDWTYGALVSPDDLQNALLYRLPSSNVPAALSVRAMECQFVAGPLPPELKTVSGFFDLRSE